MVGPQGSLSVVGPCAHVFPAFRRTSLLSYNFVFEFKRFQINTYSRVCIWQREDFRIARLSYFQKWKRYQMSRNHTFDAWMSVLFPSWLSGKESACNAGDTGDVGSIPGSRWSLGGGNGKPLLHSLPEKSHGQRSLVAYSPKGSKESDILSD